ncbi:MAG: DNA-binding protein [Eubacteriales bacterium]|nr:DNA-binding protein [Sarcina sp.]MBR2729138.1 DNA-binding protein [Lachnospiraceae bacterium]MDO4416783.1 DNA-binding protein [Eubacteriales bacterium]
MEKIVEQGLLYDFYGQLLTAHQQRIYEQAVYENLSYNEIAEAEGISRQAVHDLIRRTTALMKRYENRLGMIRRFRSMRAAADGLCEAAGKAGTRDELAARVLQIAQQIRKDLD